MVDQTVKIIDSDYGCNVLLSVADPPEASDLELTGCNGSIEREEQLITGFEKGQTLGIDVFKVNTLPSVIDRPKFISYGGEKAASVAMRYKREGRLRDEALLEVFHLEVDQPERGKGLGTLMMNIIYAYTLAMEPHNLNMSVGGGQDTLDFFKAQGIPESDLTLSDSGNIARVDTNMDRVDYDRSAITVQ